MKWLQTQNDVNVLEMPVDKRRDVATRKDFLNAADAVIRYLPDDAAYDAVGLIDNDSTRGIDASPAHRTAGGVYGLPEFAEQRDKIRTAMRVSNLGHYSTRFLLMAARVNRP